MTTDYLTQLAACFAQVEASGGLSGTLNGTMDVAVAVCRKRTTTGIIHLFGNGGSASVVAHAQNDLVKACGLRAMVYQDVPLLTAFANDHGYTCAYADALAIWLAKNDVLIAVSSAGRSDNILAAVRLAQQRGAIVITFSGFAPDNPLRQLGHFNFYVPSSNYGQVELTHAALLHCLTDRLALHA